MSTPTRPSLPASSLDFALPPSSCASTSHQALAIASDDLSPFMLRARRPSLLAPRYFSEGRLQSPLSTSFTLPLSRRYSNHIGSEESESDREKMSTDSPPSADSGANTPLLSILSSADSSDGNMKTSRPRTPTTPPRAPSTTNIDALPNLTVNTHAQRLSNTVKMPRILTLRTESHPEESEVRSEAQFQRLVASCCELPSQPRTPRAASDRGRYPEEAGADEPHREDTPSDDGELDEQPFAFVEPIGVKPCTPAHSVNGDELGMDSPGGVAMDVDTPMTLGSPIMSSWRYTPPPTSSAVRSNKRKLEDRYDPYPASKRRAVSPSISSLFSGRTSGSPRLSMPIPIPIPTGFSSGASSPILPTSSSYFATSRGSFSAGSAMSSPTLRAQIGLSSPVLRPMVRRRFGGDEEKEVDGAGEGVNGLSLG